MSESEVDRNGAGGTGPGNASAKQRALVAYLNAIPTAQREATLRLMQDLNADADAADIVNIAMNAYVLAATAEQLTQMTFQLDKLARRPPLQPDLSELKTVISQLRSTPSSPQVNPIRLGTGRRGFELKPRPFLMQPIGGSRETAALLWRRNTWLNRVRHGNLTND